MLNKLLAVTLKDLMQLRRDRGALLMMFVVPIFLIAILGATFSGAGTGSAVTATLPVVNQDSGPASQALIAALRRSPSVQVKIERNATAVKQDVRDGNEVGALIIPAGFSAALRGPRPTAHVTYYTVTANRDVSAQVAQDTVQAVVQRFSFQELTQAAVLKAQSGGAANRAVARQLAQQAVVALDRRPPVAMQTVNATTHKASGPDNTVPGFALMFALFGLMAGAGSILEEKEAGTFRRLLIAPLAPQALLAGKLLAQFLQAMVQLAVLFGVGALLFKIDLGSAPLALVLLIIATSFAATGLGLVLVSFIRSQRQLRPITTLIVLSFSALGGSWWPLSIEPQWMQSLSKITITSWAMQGFNGLMIFDKTFMQVLPDIVALFIYGLICISISRRTFRFVEA